MYEVMVMEKVLVTGGAGFVGFHVCERLIKEGYDVYSIDNFSVGKNVNKKVETYFCNLTDAPAVLSIFRKVKPDYVIHLAAFARIQPSLDEPYLWISNNVNSTVNVLWASHVMGVRKVVYSSSSSVYGDNKTPFKETMKPDIKTPYALSKWMGEEMCQMFTKVYHLPCVTVRYFNVYGKRQIESGKFSTVLGVWFKAKREKQKLLITQVGKNKRDFTHIDDIVDGTYRAMLYGKSGEVYNLGCGKNYTLTEVATLVQPNKRMHKYGLKRRQEAWETKADITKAKKDLGWTPKVSLKEGIKRCL
jgi:nucleoside-diphosphate-sugar epimerase